MENKESGAYDHLADWYAMTVMVMMMVVVFLVIVGPLACVLVWLIASGCAEWMDSWQEDDEADTNDDAGCEKVENVQMSVNKSLD